MQNFSIKLTHLLNCFTVVGFLLFAVVLNTLFIEQVNATAVSFSFDNPNSIYKAGSKNNRNIELLMSAGTAGTYPSIAYKNWSDKWENVNLLLEISEHIDGQQTDITWPATSYGKNGENHTVTFDYIAIRIYPYMEKPIGFGGSQNDATGAGVIYPQADAINNLRNQEIEYRFRFWDYGHTPRVVSGASLFISRRQIDMIWSHGLNEAGTQAELTSGTYSQGGTTYPEVRGYAVSTQYDQSNIEFKATEKHNTQPTRSAMWLQRGSTDVWDMGKNNFRFGSWYIYWNGVSGTNTCSTRNGADYIRCYTVRYIPDKAEIDNLIGTVNITIELAHIVDDIEYMKKTLTFTINGRAQNRPAVSLVISNDHKNGVTEDPDASANIGLYTSYALTERYKIYYTISETGDFLPNTTTIPQLKFVWLESRVQNLALKVYLDNDNINEADATVTVALVGDPSYPYSIDTNPAYNTITFTVKDDDKPIVSIVPHPDSLPTVQEGPNVFAKFNVSASVIPYQDLQIAYTITQGGTNKIDSSFQLPTHITIAAGTTETTFSIKTTYDQSSFNEGRIRLRLDPNTAQPNTYIVATADEEKIATVHLVNTDVPVISIAIDENSTPIVTEAEEATVNFNITSNYPVAAPYNVRINLTKTGQFIEAPDHQTVQISANETASILSLPITNDETSEIHGTITATLLADSSIPKKYSVTVIETNKTASTRILDDDDTPTISVSAHSDSSPFVTEEPDAHVKFLFEVDKLSTVALVVNINVTESSANPNGTSDFIDASYELITTHTIPASKFQDVLSFPIVYDEEPEDDGKLRVTLVEDSNTPMNYHIPTAESDQFAEIMIKASTVPIVSIALNSATHFQMEESDNLVLMYDISSNINITQDNLVINIGVSENYSMLVPIAMRESTATINIGENSTIYQLPIDNDNVDEYGSTITVTIEADINTPKKYVVTTLEANRRQAVYVDDNDTPIISIQTHEDSQPSVTEQPGGLAKFEVISNILTDPGITVNILVEHEGENFIDLSSTIPTTVAISAPNLKTVIAIPLTYDNTQIPESDGKVKITLEDDQNSGRFYTLASTSADQVAIVNVLSNTTPEISIAVHNDSINGTTESNGATAKFQVSTNFAPSQNLTIAVLITEVGSSNFLPTVDSRPKSININANSTSSILEVAIVDDLISEADGQITATLQSDSANPPSYILTPNESDRSAIVNIFDDDIPVISIAVHEDSTPSVLETPGGQVKFLIASNTAPYNDLTIEFAITEPQGQGNYLATRLIIPQNVILKTGETSAIIIVPIMYHIVDNGGGEIVATLENHATDPRKYSITTNTEAQAATATILDNSSPVISVSLHNDSLIKIYEGPGAVVEFTISSNIPILAGTTLYVGYTISESHAYLDSTQALTGSVTLNSQSQEATIEVALENDSLDEMIGTVTVTLNEDLNSPITYSISNSLSERQAVAYVRDDDIPTVSITTHTDSLPSVTENLGAVAKFIVSSDIAPFDNIDIDVTVDEDQNFLPAPNLRPTFVEIAAGSTTGELIVPLEYDSVSESDGMITVTLNPVAEPVDYQLSQSDNSAIVQVKNLDIPVLSITVHEDSSPYTTESSSTAILFEITATIPFTTKTVFNFPEATLKCPPLISSRFELDYIKNLICSSKKCC